MAEQQQHFVFSDAHTTLEEDRITQQQGSANAHPSTSYGEPPPVYGHDGVALQLVPNTQQWGFNYDTAWGGYQPGASAQYDTMVPPIDYRAMNTGMFTDVFDPNFQAGRVDPTAHAVQLKAAYASAPTSVHPNWQVPSYLPVQQLRHQYHSQAPVLTPHDQLPYMYPSQLLGQPGAALPHQPQFTTPIQGRDIPEPERTPTGSTNVEPQVVFDETGRSYQAYREGKYFLPNDGDEQDRLDFQYEGFQVLLDRRLFCAPLTHIPEHVIDVACGTGIWAIDFAELFPNAHVVGTDLSAIQPQNKPVNCEFIKEDSEEPWIHDYKFDYVHLRMVFTCFDNPRRIIENAFNHMKPGAWIEFQDGSADIASQSQTFQGSALQQWSRGLINGAAAMGRDIQKGGKWKQWLIEAGFVDVEEHSIQFPVGGWPKEKKFNLAGRYMARNITDNLKGLSWKMLSGLGMAADEIEPFLDRVRTDLQTTGLDPYLQFWVVYGRKPLET